MCIIFLANKDCTTCENYENEMIHLREDLVNSLSAWVVKTVDSQLLRLYSTEKEPALVFFRHGMPLLYDGTNVDIKRNTFRYKILLLTNQFTSNHLF